MFSLSTRTAREDALPTSKKLLSSCSYHELQSGSSRLFEEPRAQSEVILAQKQASTTRAGETNKESASRAPQILVIVPPKQ